MFRKLLWLCLCAGLAEAQTAVRLKDFQTAPARRYAGAAACFDAGAVFAAGGPLGNEPWRTDGTLAGTALMVDLVPGPLGSEPFETTATSNQVFFYAQRADGSGWLWASGGASASTRPVSPISLPPSNGQPTGFQFTQLALGQRLLFDAWRDGGYQLMSTDGTAANTVELGITFAGSLARLGAQAFAACFTGAGPGLCRTDGTPAGSGLWLSTSTAPLLSTAGDAVVFAHPNGDGGFSLLATSAPDAAVVLMESTRAPRAFAPTDAGTFFWAEQHALWRTDGTAAGTAKIADVPAGRGSQLQNVLFGAGRQVFFTGFTEVTGRELWRSDGTVSGTRMVSELSPGDGGIAGVFAARTLGDRLFFSADGTKLWVSDGATINTLPYRSPHPLCVLDDAYLFSAGLADGGFALVASDGTAANSRSVFDLTLGTESSEPRAGGTVGDQVLFFVTDGGPLGQPESVRQLWSTRGTPATTQRVHPGVFVVPHLLGTDSNHAWFTAFPDAGSAVAIWATDGTLSGTRQVSVSPRVPAWVAGAREPLVIDDDGLWQLSGTARTRLSASLWGVAWSQGEAVAGACDSGLCALQTDGGLQRLAAVTPMKEGNPETVAPGPGFSVFAGYDAAGCSLWRTDGTPAGTFSLQAQSSNCGVIPLGTAGPRAVFAWHEGAAKLQLWASDGTAAGTARIFTLASAKPSGAFVRRGHSHAGFVYFTWSDDTGGGEELWRTDGTAAGTTRVSDALPGRLSGLHDFFAVSDAGVLFVADDGVHGRELWRANETETVRLTDLQPSTLSSAPKLLGTLPGGRWVVSMLDAWGDREPWLLDLDGDGGFIEPDAGTGEDAGALADAGTRAADGGSRPNPPHPPAWHPAGPPVGCGCNSSASLGLFAFLALFLLRRRLP